MSNLKNTYTAIVEHLVGDEKLFFAFPQISANSFSMALAHFERMALSSTKCGIITKIEVERVVSQYTNSN